MTPEEREAQQQAMVLKRAAIIMAEYQMKDDPTIKPLIEARDLAKIEYDAAQTALKEKQTALQQAYTALISQLEPHIPEGIL